MRETTLANPLPNPFDHNFKFRIADIIIPFHAIVVHLELAASMTAHDRPPESPMYSSSLQVL